MLLAFASSDHGQMVPAPAGATTVVLMLLPRLLHAACDADGKTLPCNGSLPVSH